MIQATTFVLEKTKRGELFVCGFCSRKYANQQQVEMCLSKCRIQVERKLATEQSALLRKRKLTREGLTQMTPVTAKQNLPRKADPRPTSTAAAVVSTKKPRSVPSPQGTEAKKIENRKAVIKKPIKRVELEEDQMTSMENFEMAVPNKSISSTESTIKDSGSAAAPDKNRVPPKNRRDQMFKYGRDGRTLFCKKCGTNFKTIDDVIQCYDAHPATEKGPKRSPSPKEAATFNSQSYKCPQCAKNHSSEKRMLACCSDQMEQQVADKEIRLFNAKEDKDKFIRDGARYVCAACNDKFFTRFEVIQCFDGHASGKVERVQKDGEEEDSSQLDRPDQVNEDPFQNGDSSDDEAFYREGSKYVCKNCGGKYFTKLEVIHCIKGH